MFGDSFFVPMRFDSKVLSEYKNILSKLLFFVWEIIITDEFFDPDVIYFYIKTKPWSRNASVQ